jgi:hypothetical protein
LLVKKYREFWQAASNYSKNYHFTDPGDLNCDQSARYQASVWSGYPGGFTQTKLYKGALQYYCGEESIGFPAGWYWSKMRIYGDGNMHVPGDIYVYP